MLITIVFDTRQIDEAGTQKKPVIHAGSSEAFSVQIISKQRSKILLCFYYGFKCYYYICYVISYKKKLLSPQIAGGPAGPAGNLRRHNNFNLNKFNSFYLFLIISTLGAYERQLSRIMRLFTSKIKTHSKEPEGFPPVRGEP